MIRNAFFLARKDLRLLFREWGTWIWVFILPVFFFYFIGTITGGMAGPAPAETIGLVVGSDPGFLVEEFVHQLEAIGYKIQRGDEQTLMQYGRMLKIPDGFTKNILAGKQSTISFTRFGTGITADNDELKLKRAAYSVLADLIAAVKRTGETTPESFQKAREAPHKLKLSTIPAGTRQIVPTGFQQAVPGTIVQFILLMMFLTGGISLYQERNRGILRRLASSPMPRSAVVLGKALSRLAIGVIQIAFAMAAGTILFKVDWGPHLLMVLAVLIIYAALAVLGGMILGNFGKNEAQIGAIGVILSNTLAAIGGCWWPIEITPAWAQKASLVLPTGWAMGAMHRLISFGDSPFSALPYVFALAAAVFCAGYWISKSFRFQ
jgi:ABC-2 type transport system permease protein